MTVPTAAARNSAFESPRTRAAIAYLSRAFPLAVLYVFFAHLGLQFHAVSSFAALVWPPTGIALTGLLLLGNRYWPSIAVGAVVANVWNGAPLMAAFGIGAGNTLEAVAAAFALRRIPGFRVSLDRLVDVLGLVALAGVLSTTLSASIGVACLRLAGIVPAGHVFYTWQAWWLGDAIGDMVFASLLLTWCRPQVGAAGVRQRPVEAALLCASLVLASIFIFDLTRDGLAAMLSPLLVWAAIRFEQRGAASATFLVSMVAIWATGRGHGPFVRDTAADGLVALQTFMALTATTFLVLAAVTSERRRAKEEAEAASVAKDQFLAALSHELRTPLTPILALSSVIEQNASLPEEIRRQIEIVRRNTELEARLIDDLLDLTRIARGKLQIEPRPTPLAEALDHVVEIYREEAAAKKIIFEREGDPAGILVRADPARLRQVLWNIVKNAIKFTPPGGRILLRTSEPAAGRVAVEVSDTGAGIDPSDIQRIFRPFEQAKAGQGGLGLGLTISSALVEALGGTLTAASEGAGRGATFRMELESLADARRKARASSRPASSRSEAGGRRVLLVEDHRDTLDAARELLQELSCEVVTAATVAEAIAAAEKGSFDLVVSDLGLPDGSGVDLMRRLRGEHGLDGIALSGYGMEQDVQRSREAGFVEHLVKPITFQQLADAIDRFFARRPAKARAAGE